MPGRGAGGREVPLVLGNVRLISQGHHESRHGGRESDHHHNSQWRAGDEQQGARACRRPPAAKCRMRARGHLKITTQVAARPDSRPQARYVYMYAFGGVYADLGE